MERHGKQGGAEEADVRQGWVEEIRPETSTGTPEGNRTVGTQGSRK